ncbi:MAG: mechanosensitive ion channel [Gammaproteobacteria bacterium]|nr:mechanosensitive ion channel [Gammaproteobacteria bacterium]
MEVIESFLNSFTHFDLLAMGFNLLVLTFAGQIISRFPAQPHRGAQSRRTWGLRALNIGLLSLYLLSGLVKIPHLRELSQTGLVFLVTYLCIHFAQAWLMQRFGRERSINGEQIKSYTYQSEMFGLLVLLAANMLAFLVIVNIWEVTNWLQTTSVVGGLLVVLFATREVWVPDTIQGLIILYNGDFEPGSVIEIPELGLLGITLRTTLTQTTLRDLQHHNLVVIPNHKLRNHSARILSNSPSAGLVQYVDFNIGFKESSKTIENFCTELVKQAIAIEPAINAETKPRCYVKEVGDHAVTWRIVYRITNVFRLLQSRYAINRAALDLSRELEIDLDTPLTHQIKPVTTSEQVSA